MMDPKWKHGYFNQSVVLLFSVSGQKCKWKILMLFNSNWNTLSKLCLCKLCTNINASISASICWGILYCKVLKNTAQFSIHLVSLVHRLPPRLNANMRRWDSSVSKRPLFSNLINILSREPWIHGELMKSILSLGDPIFF